MSCNVHIIQSERLIKKHATNNMVDSHQYHDGYPPITWWIATNTKRESKGGGEAEVLESPILNYYWITLAPQIFWCQIFGGKITISTPHHPHRTIHYRTCMVNTGPSVIKYLASTYLKYRTITTSCLIITGGVALDNLSMFLHISRKFTVADDTQRSLTIMDIAHHCKIIHMFKI